MYIEYIEIKDNVIIPVDVRFSTKYPVIAARIIPKTIVINLLAFVIKLLSNKLFTYVA